MDWNFDRRLALAALAVGTVIALAGLGITILWPEVKPLGWLFLFLAGVLFCGWLAFELIQIFGKNWKGSVAVGFCSILCFSALLFAHSKYGKGTREMPDKVTVNTRPGDLGEPPTKLQPVEKPIVAPPTAKSPSAPRSMPRPSKESAPNSPPSEAPQEQTALEAGFVSPSSPSIYVSNPSDEVVEKITWSSVWFRTSDLCFFSFTTQDVGYVKAKARSANYSMQLETLPRYTQPANCQLQEGDELTGSVSVDCPRCSIQTYIVHLVWKVSGWFFKWPQGSGYILPKEMTDAGKKKYIELLTSGQFADQRTQIK